MGRRKQSDEFTFDLFLNNFWRRVDILDKDECWEWGGFRNNYGYGCVSHNRKTRLAHRMSWILEKGLINNGLFVCHHCDNPGCVNPGHLFLGTQKDNITDARNKNRLYGAIGELSSLSKLKWSDVRKIRKMIGAGLRCVKIAKLYNVSHTTINGIKHNLSWKES